MADKSTRGWTTKHTPIQGFPDRPASAMPEDDEESGEPRGASAAPEPGDLVTAEQASAGKGPDYPADLVFIVGPDGTILFVNRELPGVPQGQVLGSSIYQYIFPEQHDVVRECLDRVFTSGNASGYECSGMRPHDAKSWYQCRVAPNRREGRVVSATIIARDITGLKKTEEQLRRERETLQTELEERSSQLAELKKAWSERLERESERQEELGLFRDLMDRAGEAIFITDPATGRFLDVNNTACRWLGRSREELLTLTINDVELHFPVQTRETIEEHVVDTRNTMRPRVLDNGFHRRRDGSTFPVEVAIARRNLDRGDYILAVAREINSRKRTEAALREAQDHFETLFMLSHDAVYLSARDGTVAEANDAAVELFGYPRETLVGAPAKQLYRRPDQIRQFQRAVAEQGAVRDMRVELVRRDGSTIPALLSATLRKSGDGQLLGYQCVLRPSEERATNHASPEPAEAARPEARDHAGTVLLIDPNPQTRFSTADVLERAGISVVATGPDIGDAGFDPPEQIDLVLLGAETDPEAARGVLQDVRGEHPAVRVVAIGDSDESAAALRSELGEVVVSPGHPLALVQRVREALVQRPPPSSPA